MLGLPLQAAQIQPSAASPVAWTPQHFCEVVLLQMLTSLVHTWACSCQRPGKHSTLSFSPTDTENVASALMCR